MPNSGLNDLSAAGNQVKTLCSVYLHSSDHIPRAQLSRWALVGLATEG